MQSIVFFNIFPQYQYAKLKINKFNFLGYIDYYKRESVNLTKYKKKHLLNEIIIMYTIFIFIMLSFSHNRLSSDHIKYIEVQI